MDFDKEITVKSKFSIALSPIGGNEAPYFAYHKNAKRLLIGDVEGISGIMDSEAIEKLLSGEGVAYNLAEVEEIMLFLKQPMKIESDKTYKRSHDATELTVAYLAAVGRGMRHMPPPVDNFKPLVAKKIVAVSTKVVSILRNLRKKTKVKWNSLFSESKSRSELVATFLAVLELVKAHRVTIDGNGEKMTVTLSGKEK